MSDDKKLARAERVLRELLGYSAADLINCLCEDASIFQYVGDVLAEVASLKARLVLLEAVAEAARNAATDLGCKYRGGPCQEFHRRTGQTYPPICPICILVETLSALDAGTPQKEEP